MRYQTRDPYVRSSKTINSFFLPLRVNIKYNFLFYIKIYELFVADAFAVAFAKCGLI